MSTRGRARRLRENVLSRGRYEREREREGNLFSLARINLRVQVNQFPGPRRDLPETGTSRYAFYNIFPSQFPFAHRPRGSKVPLGRGEKAKQVSAYMLQR